MKFEESSSNSKTVSVKFCNHQKIVYLSASISLGARRSVCLEEPRVRTAHAGLL